MSREGRARWDFGWRKSSHFIIGKPGDPMMHRWRLLQTPWFGIYVHLIYREDLDPVPHDHPWAFWSLILRGSYVEELHDRPGNAKSRMVVRRRGRAHRFPLHWAHRIVLDLGSTHGLTLTPGRMRWRLQQVADEVDEMAGGRD